MKRINLYIAGHWRAIVAANLFAQVTFIAGCAVGVTHNPHARQLTASMHNPAPAVR